MISHFILLILGFVLLVKGADYFVEYSARIAKKLGVSDFVVGLTIVSIGTSIPELANAITATIEGHPGIIIGNVVGSNIANIGLILGSTAILRSFKTDRKMYARDGFIMITSVILFFVFVLDNMIYSYEAIIFMVFYVFYILFLIKSDKDPEEEKRYAFHNFMNYVFDFQYLGPIKNRLLHKALRKEPEERTAGEQKAVKIFTIGLLKDLSIIVLCSTAIISGARFLVEEAVWLAGLLSISENIIGLSIVAMGTTLPEFSVAVSAAKKGKGNMVVGNVIGSNIGNILLIIGISGSIAPMPVSEISVTYTIPIMLFFCLGLLYFIRSNWEMNRKNGIIALIAYIVFITMAFIMGWS